MEKGRVTWIDALARLDLDATTGTNRANSGRVCRTVFGWASRLGDGWAWYALAAALLLVDGSAAIGVLIAMVIGATVGTGIYTLLKRGIRRRRPCAVRADLILTVAPLDRFSFPSGHTLHAVFFAAVATAHAPVLGWILWPFTIVVALSRLVLGLHFPSDVLAGGTLGATLAWAVLAIAAAAGVPI